MKNIIATVFLLATLCGMGIRIYAVVSANWEWENNVLSSWNLSDKASTIAAKSQYIDKFIASLQSASLGDNDALIWKTADNNCANNVAAVTTLRDRLDQIKGMDESSFQYQQAIQQITAQEQGEAGGMLHTLKGCWMKANHYVLWNPFYVLGYILALIVGISLTMGLYATSDD